SVAAVLDIADGGFCPGALLLPSFDIIGLHNCHYFVFSSSPSRSHFSTALISSVSGGVVRVRLALVRLSAVSKISLSESSVIPACMPKVLVATILVCPVSKAILTRRETRRVAKERFDLATAFSIIDGRVAACCW